MLRTARLIDKEQDYLKVRKEIAAVKALMPKVFSDVVSRAMHLHGALGVSEEMPFMAMLSRAEVMAVADGPTEVHKVTVAGQLLRGVEPVDGLWPSAHLPSRRAAAQARLGATLEAGVVS
ncbi:acyl-CoA dehydrogenase family protein [Janibacter limosus]|uniref:acyl-CoA dehydrogenase family protein n=1 Tax=Janibacter limosus TaxID=53458 RepID=UPI0021525A72|nr:acyl-CoA dehydrogenase family protein [Janibacter limosus]WKV16228.1 acyl-CoA dehydrogenase family protein [Janibacter limosus]